MYQFSRPIPPALGDRVELQLLELRKTTIKHNHQCGLGRGTDDWGWLEDPDELHRHLMSYSNAEYKSKKWRTGVIMYGQTSTGHSVAVWVPYKSTFRVEVHHTTDIPKLIERVRATSQSKRHFDYTVEQRPRHYGWRSDPVNNRQPYKYTTIVVETNTDYERRQLVTAFTDQEFEEDGDVVEIHELEKDFPTELKFYVEMKLNYTRWVSIPVMHRVTRQHRSDYELVLADTRDLVVFHDRIEAAPFSMLALDIEAHSPSGAFPKPEVDENIINMVSLVHRLPDGTERPMLFRLVHNADEKPMVHNVDPGSDDPNLIPYEERLYASEKHMLLAIRAYIVVMDIRWLLTFNGDGFDMKYIIQRAYKCGIDMSFFLNMGVNMTSEWAKSKVKLNREDDRRYQFFDPLTASTMIDATIKFDVWGCTGLDFKTLFKETMKGVKRYTFKYYSLNNAAKRFTGTTKLDVSPDEMNRIWKEGTPAELRHFCDYCIVDSRLLLAILDKEMFVNMLMAMSDKQHLSVHGIVNEGPFKKSKTSIVVWAAKRDIFIRNDPYIPYFEAKGALVLDPVVGAHGTPDAEKDKPTGDYIDTTTLPPFVRGMLERVLSKEELEIYMNTDGVGTLDFKSLYPSIMISFIMCLFTLLPKGIEFHSRVELQKRPAPVSEEGLDIHEEIIYEDDDPSKKVLRKHRFVQNAEGDFRMGIVAAWEKELMAKRVEEKYIAKTDPARKAVFTARQNATKITMNALYGAMFLLCRYIAESVTNRGRLMLRTIMATCKELGYKVIYGDTDSIMVKGSFESEEDAYRFYSGLAEELNKRHFSGKGDINVLEFEKFAPWFLLLGRKAYFMYMKEKITDDYTLSSTGTCDVRRDRPAVLTDITVKMGEIMSSLRRLPVQITGKVVLELLMDHFEGMVQNTHPIDKYTVTTTIRTINETTEKKAHMIIARRLEEEKGIPITIGDVIDVVQVKGPPSNRDAENTATPQELLETPNGMDLIDHHLYFEKKVKDQVVKMAKWYIPETTLTYMLNEYDRALKEPPVSRKTKARAPKSHNIFEMCGGDERERRYRTIRKSYADALNKSVSTPVNPSRKRKPPKSGDIRTMWASKKANKGD